MKYRDHIKNNKSKQNKFTKEHEKYDLVKNNDMMAKKLIQISSRPNVIKINIFKINDG